MTIVYLEKVIEEQQIEIAELVAELACYRKGEAVEASVDRLRPTA